MNSLFQIPHDHINNAVRPIVRQKTIAVILTLIVCILLEMQGNQSFHLLGFKSLSKAESWFIVDITILLFMLFGVSVVQKRFTAYYTGFRVLLTNEGIKSYYIADTESEPKTVCFFAWKDIKRIQEKPAGLKILNGTSTLIPGTQQIAIPKQIEHYNQLKLAIQTYRS